MISYFVPITLLMLAAFGLGLLVGRLAWGSSWSGANRERRGGPNVQREAMANTPPSATDTTDGVPTWKMREVRTRRRKGDITAAEVEDSGGPADAYDNIVEVSGRSDPVS